MKNVFTFFMVLFLFLSVNLSAQQTENYDYAITANPLGLAFGLFNAQFEFQTSQNNSFLVRGNYWTPGVAFSNWTAYGIGASYRWYLDAFKQGTTAITGFSFGPAVAVDFWSWDLDDDFGFFDDYDGGATFRIGAEANYKWIWGGFALEPGINIMFAVSDVEGLGTLSPFGILFNIGYAW
jgi:hypothetical protein